MLKQDGIRGGHEPSFIKMVSRLDDRDGFLDVYKSFVDGNTILVFGKEQRPLGTRLRFAIHLKDGTKVLSGSGVIVKTWPPSARGKSAKLQLDIRALDPGGELVMHDLRRRKLAARKRAQSAPPKIPKSNGEKRPAKPSAAPEPKPNAAPEPKPSAAPEPKPSAAPEPKPSAAPEPERPKRERAKLVIAPRAERGTATAAPEAKRPKPAPPKLIVTPEVEVENPTAEPVPEPVDAEDEKTNALPRPQRAEPAGTDLAVVEPERAEPTTASEPEPVDAGDEKTNVLPEAERAEPVAAPEPERAAGGTEMLPANPLSDISDDALGGFIEYVLHDGVRFGPPDADDETSHPDEAKTAAPPEAASPAPAVPAAAPAQPVYVPPPDTPPVTVKSGLGTNILIAVLAAAAGVFGAYYFLNRNDAPPRASGNTSATRAPERTATAPVRPPDTSQPSSRPAATTTTKPAHPAQPDKATTPDVAEPKHQSGNAVSANTDSKPTEPEAKPGKPEAKPTEPEAKPTEPESSTIAGDGCKVAIKTHPESWVYFDKKRIGHPPLDKSVPCGEPFVVSIKHPRYQEYKRSLKLRPGELRKLDITLVRPLVKLRVRSSPAGATVSVNGRIIGRTPTQTMVRAHTNLWITASRDGYKSWAKRIRARNSGASVSARLVAIP